MDHGSDSGADRPAVSRETPSAPPDPPDEARRVFSSTVLPVMAAYAAELAEGGVVRGLIGPREVPRLWERHLVNCAVVSELIPHEASVCDVGTGAGLPGLVLAIHRPDLRITLLEPLLRRTTFLDEVTSRLALGNVTVLRGRAEQLHGERAFDVVTSRAVAPLARLLDWSVPLAAPDGAVVAMKGSSARREIQEAASTLDRLGCAAPVVHELGADVLARPAVAVRVVRVADGDPGR